MPGQHKPHEYACAFCGIVVIRTYKVRFCSKQCGSAMAHGKRPIPNVETPGQITLTRGAVAFFDEEDEPLVRPFLWSLRSEGRQRYALRTLPLGSSPRTLFLHRAVLGLTDRDVCVDHIDCDGLNNRKSNLRTFVRQGFNMANSRLRTDNPSGFKGVHRHFDQWRVSVAGEYLGIFPTKEEAARVYDAAAIAKWGNFARLNFPVACGD
jgi:hypothetical protein